MELKQKFCMKIYDELQAYKKSSMRDSKEEIFGNAFKTEVFVNLYEILLDSADKFSDVLLANLVNQSAGILESLYQDFLSKSPEDAFYEDLKEHVENEFGDESEVEWWNNPVYQEGA